MPAESVTNAGARPIDSNANAGSDSPPGSASPHKPAGGATRGLLQIGEVADLTGLSLKTVRYYEEVGLLPTAERSPGGFRLYTTAAVERLLVIKQMKPLDFNVEQMRELLGALDELAAGPSRSRREELSPLIADYHSLVGTRMAKLRERLAGARDLNATLEDLLLS